MADGVTVATGNNTSPPNSTKIATDDAGASGHVQLVKLAYSADGSATVVDADANGLKVQVSTGAVTASGSLSLTTATTGGMTIYQNLDLDNTKVAVKASAGTLFGWHITNSTTAPIFVKFWDVASGSVTVGTTAATMVLGVPGASASNLAGVTQASGLGIAFGTAITIACTTGVATASNSDPGANACCITLWYA